MTNIMIVIGSDFSGVGSLNQALAKLGIKYKELFACEIDKYARQTFELNYGAPAYFPMDVYKRKIPKKSLDLYVSTPPCQPFSITGKRAGEKDKRGVLFYNTLDFIRVNKPRFFIIENVKGLISHDCGNTFRRWINCLGGKSINGVPLVIPYENSVPYHIYYNVLNSKNYGVPQNRERVFIVGIRDDRDNYFNFPKSTAIKILLRDLLEKDVPNKYNLSIKGCEYVLKRIGKYTQINGDIAMCHTTQGQIGLTGTFIYQLNDSKESGGKQPYQQNRVYADYGIMPTIDTDGRNNILTNGIIRRLTPREVFRLFSYPETFKWNVSDSQAYKQAGNSVVVNVLAEIIKRIFKN